MRAMCLPLPRQPREEHCGTEPGRVMSREIWEKPDSTVSGLSR